MASVAKWNSRSRNEAAMLTLTDMLIKDNSWLGITFEPPLPFCHLTLNIFTTAIVIAIEINFRFKKVITPYLPSCSVTCYETSWYTSVCHCKVHGGTFLALQMGNIAQTSGLTHLATNFQSNFYSSVRWGIIYINGGAYKVLDIV